MVVHFWGVRGSLPAPLTPEQIQSKIIAAVQRITPKDIESAQARERFISNLPSWIFGTAGGNTPCVTLKNKKTNLIFDAGTGLRLFGKAEKGQENVNYHMLMSHFHWDHIQGLPFFDPFYNPNAKFYLYSPIANVKDLLIEQFKSPFFPPNALNTINKNITTELIEPGKDFFIDDLTLNLCKMSHPDNSYSYSVYDGKKKFVYATDVELKNCDFEKNEINSKVFQDADVIVIDSQYTVEEAYKKVNWGHSAFCYVIDFAVFWNIKEIYLFHHEPMYDDKKLNSILQAARWYAQYINHSEIKIHLAKESREIIL